MIGLRIPIAVKIFRFGKANLNYQIRIKEMKSRSYRYNENLMSSFDCCSFDFKLKKMEIILIQKARLYEH